MATRKRIELLDRCDGARIDLLSALETYSNNNPKFHYRCSCSESPGFATLLCSGNNNKWIEEDLDLMFSSLLRGMQSITTEEASAVVLLSRWCEDSNDPDVVNAFNDFLAAHDAFRAGA